MSLCRLNLRKRAWPAKVTAEPSARRFPESRPRARPPPSIRATPIVARAIAPQARRGTRSPRNAWAPIAVRKGVMPPMKVAFATVTRPSARMKRTEDALEQTPARTAGQPASRIACDDAPAVDDGDHAPHHGRGPERAIEDDVPARRLPDEADHEAGQAPEDRRAESEGEAAASTGSSRVGGPGGGGRRGRLSHRDAGARQDHRGSVGPTRSHAPGQSVAQSAPRTTMMAAAAAACGPSPGAVDRVARRARRRPPARDNRSAGAVASRG